MDDNLYSVLGVSSAAVASEIRLAYKRQALHCHPDKPGGTAEAFRRVIRAFETLFSTRSRAAYDAYLERRRLRLLERAQQVAAPGRPQHSGRFERPAAPQPWAWRRSRAQPWPHFKSAFGRAATCGAPGAAKGEQAGPGQYSARGVLARRLARLQRLIGSCPPEERRAAVGQMSQALQKELVSYIEGLKAAEAGRPAGPPDGGARPPTSAPPPASRKRRGFAFRAAKSRSCGGAIAAGIPRTLGGGHAAEEDDAFRPGLADEGDYFSDSDAESPSPLALEDDMGEDGSDAEGAAGAADAPQGKRHAHRVGHRGLCQIHAKQGILYYEARIMLRGLTLATRTTRDLEEGINFHTILGAVRQRVQELEDQRQTGQAPPTTATPTESGTTQPAAGASGVSHPFVECLRQALAEVEGVSTLALTYQVCMDARQWIGRMVNAPRMGQDEGLSTWIQLEEARVRGSWPELRKIWVGWMMKQRRRCWCVRTRSPGEAEEHATVLERGYAATREHRENIQAMAKRRVEGRAQRRAAREARRAKRCEAQLRALMEVALPRAIAFAERSVQGLQRKGKRPEKQQEVEATLQRKRKKEEARSRERMWKQRRCWTRQDLTMQQIRTGFRSCGVAA